MRLIIDKESFKSFSKVVLTCTRLGEDIFFECRHNCFTIKSVNDARSLFFFTKFERKFFEEYQVPDEIECKFKAKSCIIPFKSATSLEKNIDTLEFYVDKDKDGATFQMNFDTNDITIHEIGFINTTLQVDIDEDIQLSNYLMSKIKSLVSLFNNFPNVSDYCVMTVTEDKVCFETYNFKMNEIHTTFTVKKEVFLEYRVIGKIRCTFVLKPMKTFLNSLDKNANCYFYFEEDNCPIHLIIRNNFIEHKFIIASIDVDIDSITENSTNIKTPKEMQTLNSDLMMNDQSSMNDEEMAVEEDKDSDDNFSSSYDTDQTPSFNKPKSEPFLYIKNERYSSIYSPETSTDDASLTPEDENNTINNKDNLNKADSSLLQVTQNDNLHTQRSSVNSQIDKSQIDDSQIMFDDDNFSFSSINCDFKNQDTCNKTSKIFQSKISISDGISSCSTTLSPQQKMKITFSTIQSNINQETYNKSSMMSEKINDTLVNRQQLDNKTYPSSNVCSNIDQSINETIQKNQSNNQTYKLNKNNNQYENSNITKSQTINSVSKRSVNSHSTQENDDESIKMNSINLSRIESNSSMNNEFNDDDDWNFEVDLLANENANEDMEQQIKKLKSTYDALHEKMPAMCTNQKQNEDKESMFAQFLNKNRGLLP